MKYWVAYDEHKHYDEVVAFHEEKEVVQKYIDSITTSSYKLGRCKSSELKKIKDVEGLYLVKHLGTYVQSRFYDLCDYTSQSAVSEYKTVIHTLERLLVVNEPEKSDKKSIINTIAYLKEIISDLEDETLDYETLQREYSELELMHAKKMWGDNLDFSDADRLIKLGKQNTPYST